MDLSCLLEGDEGSSLPSISDILLLHLALQRHDKSYVKAVKYRDALRWPFKVEDDCESSLLEQLTEECPYRSAAWTKRNPEPILPIQRAEAAKQGDFEDEDDALIEDDSEIEDLTVKKSSPWTPLQHSPILYETIIDRIVARTDVNMDPLLQRTITIGIMKKVETLLERVRCVQENLPKVRLPLDVPFILNICKTVLNEEQASRVQERYKSIIDLSKNLNDKT
jgi:hypothetical protein